MTSVAPKSRHAALQALDVSAIRDVVRSVPPPVWALGPWATAMMVLKSLARLTQGGGGGTSAAPTVAMNLTQNGVAADLEALAQAPQQLAQLSSVGEYANRFVAPPPLPMPALPGLPTLSPLQVAARLSALSQRIAGNESTFAALSMLGTIWRAISIHDRMPDLNFLSTGLPMLGAAAGEADSTPWPQWGLSLATMSGAFTSLGFCKASTRQVISPLSVTRRLDAVTAAAAAPPPQTGAPPIPLDQCSALLSAVTALNTVRYQLSIDMLRPGWPDAMQTVISRAASVSQRLATSGDAMPDTAQLQQLASIRGTLGTVNRLQAFGLPLRAPDGRTQLAAVMAPLQQFNPPRPCVAIGSGTDTAGDPAYKRLVQALSFLYSSLMLAPARRHLDRTRRHP